MCLLSEALCDLHWPEVEAHCTNKISKLKRQASGLDLWLRSICLFDDVLHKRTRGRVWFGGKVPLLASTCLTLQLKYAHQDSPQIPAKNLIFIQCFKSTICLCERRIQLLARTPPHPWKKGKGKKKSSSTQSDAWCDHSNMRDELWRTLTHTQTSIHGGVIQSSLFCCSVCRGVPAEAAVELNVSLREKERLRLMCVCAKEQGNMPREFWASTLKGAFTGRETNNRGDWTSYLNVNLTYCIVGTVIFYT